MNYMYQSDLLQVFKYDYFKTINYKLYLNFPITICRDLLLTETNVV